MQVATRQDRSPQPAASGPTALSIVFSEARETPFLVKRSEWVNKQHVLRSSLCIGVQNNSPATIDPVRVIVEEIDTGETKVRPERALQVFDRTEGATEACVHPDAHPNAYFEFLEQIDPTSEWVWLCYANRSNEDIVPGHATIRLRAEGGGTIARRSFTVWTHETGGRFVGLQARAAAKE